MYPHHSTAEQLTATMGLANFLQKRKDSDLAIACDGHVFKVHKRVLCAKSAVIAKECGIDMREADGNHKP